MKKNRSLNTAHSIASFLVELNWKKEQNDIFFMTEWINGQMAFTLLNVVYAMAKRKHENYLQRNARTRYHEM